MANLLVSKDFEAKPSTEKSSHLYLLGRASKLNNFAGLLRPLDEGLSAEYLRNRLAFDRLPFAACSPSAYNAA
jgi:hypothetical protein